MIEERISRVAEKVKQVRMQHNLSIREAARLSSTSPATIQKIESGEMVPTIATLMKIAQGLNRSMGFFFEEEDDLKEVVLIRKRDRRGTKVAASKLYVEDLGVKMIDAKLEPTMLTIEKGGNSGREPLLHLGEEIKYCVEGSLAYYVDGVEYILEPGDCIHFSSEHPHSWKNLAPGNTVVLSVCTPPLFSKRG